MSSLLVGLVLGACSQAGQRGPHPEQACTGDDILRRDCGGSLDGRAFAIEIGEMGEPVSRHEVIEFAGGKLGARTCEPHGFGQGVYTTRDGQHSVAFTAVCVSTTQGRNQWHGTIVGDSIQGDLLWTARNRPPLECWYRGVATRR